MSEAPLLAPTKNTVRSQWLNAEEFHLIELICNTFFPSLQPPAVCSEATAQYYQMQASDLHIPAVLIDILADLEADEQAAFRYFLSVMTLPASSLMLVGVAKPFSELTLEQREKYLLGLAQSPLPQIRQGYQVLKRLTGFLFFTLSNDNGDNPAWATLDYTLPTPLPSQEPRPIQPLAVNTDMTLHCDVVIIGSGAGGGVVAGELARAGKDVLVLEQGAYYSDADLTMPEGQAMSELYMKQGAMTTSDLGIILLAGRSLGGGTTVNWSTSLRTPAEILVEWEEQSGLPLFTSTALQDSFAAVEQRISVNLENSAHNPQNQLLFEGARNLGYHAERVPRNVLGCRQRCGACGFGCAYGCKQSTTKTYLQDAYDHGARMLVSCYAERVLIKNKCAVGVEGRVQDASTGKTYRVTVHAKSVVVAAGALHSPALLLRSGVENKHIGQHLHLHPTSAMSAFYPEEVHPWSGGMQSAYSREFAYLKGNHGYMLEVPPTHPGLLGMGAPWMNALSFREEMARAAHIATFIVLTRDKGEGRVVLDARGAPVAHYVTAVFDRHHLLHGLRTAARIHFTSGALEVFSLQSQRSYAKRDADGTVSERLLRNLDAQLERHGLGPNKILLFSAHQMGTCRIGHDARHAVVNADFQVHGVQRLYVCDSSVFPSASGVNPMLSIMALAHQATQRIHAAL